MKTKVIRTILAGLAVAILVAAAPGCIDNAKSLVIVAAIPYEAGEASDDGLICEATIQEETKFEYQSSGLLDLNYAGFAGQPKYDLVVQVHNYVLTTADPENGIINGNDVQMERFEVRYKWLVGRELLEDPVNFPPGPGLLLIEDQKVISPTSGIVGAASEVDAPGKTLSYMLAIPSALVGGTLTTMEQTYVDSLVLGVKVKVIGKTLGGSRIESNEFVFPIYFCWGCHSCPNGTTYASCKPGQDTEYFCIPPPEE